jgi:hypothetical protein
MWFLKPVIKLRTLPVTAGGSAFEERFLRYSCVWRRWVTNATKSSEIIHPPIHSVADMNFDIYQGGMTFELLKVQLKSWRSSVGAWHFQEIYTYAADPILYQVTFDPLVFGKIRECAFPTKGPSSKTFSNLNRTERRPSGSTQTLEYPHLCVPEPAARNTAQKTKKLSFNLR